MQRWIGTSSTTQLRSRRIVNDGYGKLVSRFPHLLLTMDPHLNSPPILFLTHLFYEHTMLVSMTSILRVSPVGYHPLIHHSNAHHRRRTITLFPTLLLLTLPMPTTSLESYLTILHSIIRLPTTHIPSPWWASLPRVQHQRLQWLIRGRMFVSLAILLF